MAGGDSDGGSSGLASLIDKAGEELLFDFRHYLGIDFLDVLRDGSGLTPRLALAYIRQLPPESATQAALAGDSEYRGWTLDTYLQANQVDLMQYLIFAFVSAHSDKRKPKKPEPLQRPGDRKRRQEDPNSFANQARRALQQGKGSNGGAGSTEVSR